jgi:hypothetical protein
LNVESIDPTLVAQHAENYGPIIHFLTNKAQIPLPEERFISVLKSISTRKAYTEAAMLGTDIFTKYDPSIFAEFFMDNTPFWKVYTLFTDDNFLAYYERYIANINTKLVHRAFFEMVREEIEENLADFRGLEAADLDIKTTHDPLEVGEAFFLEYKDDVQSIVDDRLEFLLEGHMLNIEHDRKYIIDYLTYIIQQDRPVTQKYHLSDLFKVIMLNNLDEYITPYIQKFGPELLLSKTLALNGFSTEKQKKILLELAKSHQKKQSRLAF